MVFSKRSLRNSIFFLLLIFWMVAFGFFEGYAHQEGTRILGNYLIVNLAAVILFILIFPIKIKLAFPGVRMFVLLVLWLVIICFYQQDSFQATKKLSNILLTQLLLVIMANYAWKIDFFKLIELYIYHLLVIMVMVVIVQITKVSPITFGTHTEEARMGGMFSFGQAATIAGVGLLFTTYQLMFYPLAKKIVYIPIALFFVFCLVACDLRTGIGAAAAAVCVQYLYLLKSQKKSIFPFLILIAVLYGSYKAYVAFNESGNMVSSDLAYRQLIWSYSIPGILKRPFAGYGSAPAFFTNNMKTFAFNSVLSDPHSSYLSLMLQSGVVTMVLLVLFVARVFRFNFRGASFQTKAMISVVVYWAIIGSTGGEIFNLDYDITSVNYLFTLLALCGHPYHLAENRQAILNRAMMEAYV